MNPFVRPLVIALAAHFFTISLVSPVEAGYSPFVSPPASYLLQVNGETYKERDVDALRPPASLTKVMSALIVLEKMQDLDVVVTVSRSAARETGSRIGLRKGDRLTVRALLAATLIESANDACRALADHIGGDQHGFVVMMNAKANSLGMSLTRFRNACGHDQAGHYSTTRDLQKVALEAMQHEAFANLVAVSHMRISTVSRKKHFFSLRNKNRLIGHYSGALGIKTGTTPKAGQCLIALAKRKNTRVLLVMMNSRNRWQAASALLDAGFEYDALNKEMVAEQWRQE